MRKSFPAVAAGLLFAASSAAAQTLTSTGTSVVGTTDQAWDVKCTVIGASPSAAGTAACTNSYVDAQVVQAPLPSGWAETDAANWISIRPDATLGFTGPLTENPLYEYTFRTSFNVGLGVTPSSLLLNLDLLRLDNYWVGFRVNGGALVAGGVSPVPVPPNGANWQTSFSVAGLNNGSGAFVTGANTLELVIRGNGQTDGILARGSFAVVPEPSTYALMGAGLAGVAGIAARRRRVTA